MPFVKPVTLIGDPVPVALIPPTVETVYLVTVKPPLAPGLNEIVAVVSPKAAVIFVGV